MGVPERIIPIVPAAPGVRCDRCGRRYGLAVMTIVVDEAADRSDGVAIVILCSDCLLSAALVADGVAITLLQILQAMRTRPSGP